MKAVIALGGNAILQPKEKGSAEEQLRNIETSCEHIVSVVKKGVQVLITHGNGPQVGNILIQNRLAAHATPAMPLSVCGAQSQGMIGYMIQQTLFNTFNRMGLNKEVASIVTQVLVDKDDPAFQNPTKPIGPFYTAEEAEEYIKQGLTMKEDSGRGWRMVVPSPQPLEIMEKEAIKTLLEKGVIVVAVGGGGIPVVKDRTGNLQGVTAVIDKDLASQRVAVDIGADVLIILTGVEKVALNFNRPDQVELDRMTVTEAKKFCREGHFGAGSMLPKVIAAVQYLEQGGEKAIITSLDKLEQALDGMAGTLILPS